MKKNIKSIKNKEKSYKKTYSSNLWQFTLHIRFRRTINLDDFEVKKKYLISKLSEQKVQSALVSLEYGKCGNRPHFQGYLKFFKKLGPIQWFGLKETHFEMIKSTESDNIQYVSGVNKSYEAPGNIIYEKNVPWPSRVLEEYHDKMKNSGLIRPQDFYPWEKNLLDYYVKVSNDTRNILWIFETKGSSGKTSFAKYLSYFHGGLPVGGKAGDLKYAIKAHFDATQRYPQLVLVDIPRADVNKVSYSAIENVKDSMFFSTKYESEGCKTSFHPIIFCFANYEPKMDELSKDRWIILKIKNKKFIVKYDKNKKFKGTLDLAT